MSSSDPRENPYSDDFTEDQGETSQPKTINVLSVGVFVIIAVLSILVGSLWAANNTRPVVDSTPKEEASPTDIVPLSETELGREVIAWNASVRDSIAATLEVLGLEELSDFGEGITDEETEYVFYRMCNDIQGYYKDLDAYREAPEPNIEKLYNTWADSVTDVALTCQEMTEDSFDTALVDFKVRKSWEFFNSYFVVVEPFIKDTVRPEERQ